MKTNVTFELKGFSAQERDLAALATRFTADLFFPKGDFPPLKSNVITVVRTAEPRPMYVSGAQELIHVNCSENRPWQYTFQLAHELGHLASRADLRFPRQDGNLWIEEAICGAYSVYALREMSETDGKMEHNATLLSSKTIVQTTLTRTGLRRISQALEPLMV
jgi:hypothetical protein